MLLLTRPGRYHNLTYAWVLALASGCGFIGYERLSSEAEVDGREAGTNEDDTTPETTDVPEMFVPGSGATSRQALSVCGDSVVEGDETCDDGGPSATCHANCTPVTCDPACECRLSDGRFTMVCDAPESFDDAEARCRAHGLRLFEVHDVNDHAWITRILSDYDLETAWLGATVLVDSEVIGWRSKTSGFWRRGLSPPGGPLNGAFHQWDDGHPRHSSTLNECVRISRGSSGWRSTRCSSLRPVICEGFREPAEVDVHSLVFNDVSGEISLGWRAQGPSSVLTSYRIVVDGAEQETHTVSADFTAATLPIAPEARGLLAITVVPVAGELAGLPAMQRAVPAQGVWFEAVSQADGLLLNGIIRFDTHHLSLTQTASDGVELPTFGNDPELGENDMTQHYIIGTFQRRMARLIELEKGRSGRQLSFGLTYFDNNDRLFGIQTIGGSQVHEDAQHPRTNTQRFLSHFIDVTDADLTHVSDLHSFRLTPYTWSPGSDAPLLVHRIVLRDGL